MRSTRERAILEAQTREEGKPEQAIEKIVDGKLNGFFKTVSLLEQPFVKDQKTTIKALVDGLGRRREGAPLLPGQDRRRVSTAPGSRRRPPTSRSR